MREQLKMDLHKGLEEYLLQVHRLSPTILNQKLGRRLLPSHQGNCR